MADVESAPEQDRSRLLLEINNAIISTLDLRDLFQVISRRLRPIFGHDGGGIGLYSAEKNEIRGYALDPPKDFNVEPKGAIWPMEGTPPGLAVSTRQVVIVTEPDRTKFYSPVVHKMFDQGINSGCAVPLLRGDRVLGVLALVSIC